MSTIARNDKVIQTSRQRTSFRNVRWCIRWAALVAIGAGGVFLSLRTKVELPALLFFLYALQALIAEFIGVRVSAEEVSMPRRPIGFWAVALFWRTRARLNDIDALVSLAEEGPGVVELERAHGGSMRLLLPDGNSKRKLFEALLRIRPEVPILRGD